MARYRVGIVGATGIVGQRLVERLAGHPWFEVAVLAASERSVGRCYAEAARWQQTTPIPEEVAPLAVRPCAPSEFGSCDLVLSALDSETATLLEPRLAGAGLAVISNSSAHRDRRDVPLVVPEINPSHLKLIEVQRRQDRRGFIVTNPNCSCTGLALALAPLQEAFGIRRLVVTTLQAISGAGLGGPRAIELLENVIPHIPGEEPKMERELPKLFGRLEHDLVRPAQIAVSAHCHRIPILDGHLEAVSLELERPASAEEARRVLGEFRSPVADLQLPSAPRDPIVLRPEPDRPQPRLDRDAGGGMSVVVGRVRSCAALGLKLELLSHNTHRGAAGGALLNAELLVAQGWVEPRKRG